MSEDRKAEIRRAMSPVPAAPPAAPPAPEPAPPPPHPEPLAALPPPPPGRAQAEADRVLDACHAALASVAASQTAVAGDVTAMALELGGLTRANLTAAGDGVAALFRATSVVDALTIQLGIARRSLDAMAAGSTRLGEIGRHLADEAVKPLASRFSAG
jgi:hypothetical protein